jgi:cytochrome b
MTRPMVRVWDPLVRVFHWTLVIAFAVAWFTADEWDRAHEWAGYVIAGLVGFRLIWGLVGPRYARFTNFVRSPSLVLGYLRAMAQGREPRYLGHNPAGGAMVVALLTSLVGTAVTGWMSTLNRFWGAEWLEEVHEFLAHLLLALIVAHVLGVIWASLRHRENLVRAMLHGDKPAPGAPDLS